MATGLGYGNSFGALGTQISGIAGTSATVSSNFLQQYMIQGAITSEERKVVDFMRLNDNVRCYEGSIVDEPLDELRIKVAKWLGR